jgi:hypothetical protein
VLYVQIIAPQLCQGAHHPVKREMARATGREDHEMLPAQTVRRPALLVGHSRQKMSVCEYTMRPLNAGRCTRMKLFT